MNVCHWLVKQGCKVLFEDLQRDLAPILAHMDLVHSQALEISCSHAPVDLQGFSGDAHAIPAVLGGGERNFYPWLRKALHIASLNS